MKQTKLASLFLLLFIFVVSTTKAQKTIVRGKIIDAETKEALPFVNLSFKDSKVGTSTNIDGNYSIETYYPTDTLFATFVGYEKQGKRVQKDKTQILNFELSAGEGIQLKEVEIRYQGNPAHDILRRVWRNKEANNREKYDYYNYEVYNKVEFDLNNITENFKNRRVFKQFQFIFDYIDSTSEEKHFLPMFMTESLSDIYYRRSPKAEKEYIKASQISGTSNESVTKFLGDMYQKVNVYDNNINVFGKSFISPISTSGLLYYRYYLKDSLMVGNQYCYEIDFISRYKQEPVFEGTMWVNDTTYAIKKIEARINEGANINFVNGFKVKQEYKKIDGIYWMLYKDELIVDFQLEKNVMGFYGRKYTSYKNIEVNVPKNKKYYEGIEDVKLLDGANERNNDFWEEARHDSLTAIQKGIYEMVDSVKNVPAFRTITDIIELVFTGYHQFGKIELGPYFKTYSYNEVEGHRFRIGGRTSNDFSKRLMLNTYLAYGTRDKEFKYGGGFWYKLNGNPRRFVGFQYNRDVEQLGQSRNAFSEDNILSSILRRNPNDKLTDVESYEATYEHEWFNGLSSTLFTRKVNMRPLGSLEYLHFNPDPYIGLEHGDLIQTSEISLFTRFAYKEKYIEGEFNRVSLGSKYPILELQATFGLKGVLDGGYDYTKLEVALSDKINVGILGHTKYKLTAGKYFGTLPYPLLEIHKGNETYFYDQQAFNLMNFFEFISDEYATALITHHFDGFFLNKIPLMRKLKWREVVSLRAVAGDLDNRHRGEMVLPVNVFKLDHPYTEVAVGIENIFKILRFDAMWRLNYLDHPDIAKFGIRGAFEITF